MTILAAHDASLLGFLTAASSTALGQVLDSDAALAREAGVSRSRVARWKRGEHPGPVAYARLAALASVVLLLADVLEPRAINEWLHGANANLGDQRPLDALASGRVADVVAAAQAERTGAFA